MIYIGTSGYSYDDWIGPFYPAGIKQGDMLSYYAGSFNFTEVNFTYYRLPNAFMFFNMQKKTGDGFKFSVKLHQSMTHLRNASEKDYRDFTGSTEVLLQAGKLGCLVAQFPYSFHCTGENKDYLLELKERFLDDRLVVEFRNNKWLSEETMDFLRANAIGYVCVDEPAVAGLPDRRAIKTSGIAYIRLHGRNSEKWWNHNEAYERYDYFYKENELEEWKDKIAELYDGQEDCFISFNNHFRAQAVKNAMMLKTLLEKAE